jgi:hypothetical protein
LYLSGESPVQLHDDYSTCPYGAIPSTSKWADAVGNVADAHFNPHTAVRLRINPATKIASAGSCFAQRIAQALVARGYDYLIAEPGPRWLSEQQRRDYNYGTYSARFGNVYTARQLLQLLQRALGQFTPLEAVWRSASGRYFDPFRPRIQPAGFASAQELHADCTHHLQAVRTLFTSLQVFIFTLGMTEAWQSRQDGAVFPVCPGCGAGAFEPHRHEFRNFRIAEVVEDLERFLALLATVNPTASVVLTVSPVPLVATMSGKHVLQATVYSKSVLRVAAETVTQAYPHVEYFASYEMALATRNAVRYFAQDQRTITRVAVDEIMDRFFMTFAGDLPAIPAKSTSRPATSVDQPEVVCDELAMFEALGKQRKG